MDCHDEGNYAAPPKTCPRDTQGQGMKMKLTHISHGFYRISDADAGKLARDANTHLPREGYELAVVLPNGDEAWLARTSFKYYQNSPKRGWVWSVRERGARRWK